MRAIDVFFFGISLFLLSVGVSHSQDKVLENFQRNPIQLHAKSVLYDQHSQIVIATGQVEIIQGKHVLIADQVQYNLRTDTVLASGNISVLDPNGDVLFADSAELTEGLRQGFISSIRVLLADKSRLAANEAHRNVDGYTVMNKAVFSSCQLCPNETRRYPLWQIKAVRVVHNGQKQILEYEDALLEFFGFPVVYLPYFSHPDPSVERRSGFLSPTYGTTTQLGVRVETPYHFAIAEDRDVTISPVFTAKEGALISGLYRQKFVTGRLSMGGSAKWDDGQATDNNTKKNKRFRGHIVSSGKFSVNDSSNWGFTANRSTDDTYLRKFDIDGADTLTSSLFAESFNNRSYARINAYAFQGLRAADDPGDTPLIAPEISYTLVGEPNTIGSQYTFDANALVLERSDGTDSRRISVGAGWRLPYFSDRGDVYALHVSLRGDLFETNDVSDPFDPTLDLSDGVVSRLYPQFALDWRYPFMRNGDKFQQVVEPIASLVLSPHGGNPDSIPNEDSVSFEFDDTNIFQHNRFAGLDRVEGGPRLNFGLKMGLFDNHGGYATALLGQSLRSRADTTFADKTGLEDQRSDFVGRIYWAPSRWLDASNRFRLDRDTFSIRRNEIKLSVGSDFLRTDVDYVSLARELTTDELTSREELNFRSKLQATRYWAFDADTRRDLSSTGGTRAYGFGMTYEDECFLFSSSFERDFTSDREISPSTSINFKIRLKNLG